MFVELLTALSLVLVLEGILPFVNPQAYKKALRRALELDDRQLRILAVSSMIAGVMLLAFIR
ncbi:MAG: DUF2065 domain-containing protein [Granulosicoccus sp.]